jgi:hypothetical protein
VVAERAGGLVQGQQREHMAVSGIGLRVLRAGEGLDGEQVDSSARWAASTAACVARSWAAPGPTAR